MHNNLPEQSSSMGTPEKNPSSITLMNLMNQHLQSSAEKCDIVKGNSSRVFMIPKLKSTSAGGDGLEDFFSKLRLKKGQTQENGKQNHDNGKQNQENGKQNHPIKVVSPFNNEVPKVKDQVVENISIDVICDVEKDDDYKVDLSVGLIKNPPVACEESPTTVDEPLSPIKYVFQDSVKVTTEKRLPCLFDSPHLFAVPKKCPNIKCSALGEVICGKLNMPPPPQIELRYHDPEHLAKVKVFKFDTPSPDEIASKQIKERKIRFLEP